MGMDILRQLNRFSEKYWKNNFKFEPGLLKSYSTYSRVNENYFTFHDTDPKFYNYWGPKHIFPG